MIAVTQEELEMLLEADNRKARRTRSRFVIDWSRVKVVDEQRAGYK